MAKIYLRLSSKQNSSGKHEILGAFCSGRGPGNFIRFHTKIFIEKEFWNDKISDIKFPRVKDKNCAEVIKAKENLDNLQLTIFRTWENLTETTLSKELLCKIIENWHNKDAEVPGAENSGEIDGSINSVFDYLKTHNVFPTSNMKQYECLRRILLRYNMIIGFDGKNVNFNTLSVDDVSAIQDFIMSEHLNFDKDGQCLRYQSVYSVISEPQKVIKQRGWNYTSKMLQRLRTVVHHGERLKLFTNNPFRNYKIKSEVYGDPYYLTKEERNILMNFKFSEQSLSVQRDIFIFQCYVGVRVGDLYSLRLSNVVGNALEYVPEKGAAA